MTLACPKNFLLGTDVWEWLVCPFDLPFDEQDTANLMAEIAPSGSFFSAIKAVEFGNSRVLHRGEMHLKCFYFKIKKVKIKNS